jgi:SAM-dependent methyltransferase
MTDQCAGSSVPAVQDQARCRICGDSGKARSYEVAEMMFGTGDVFRYLECSSCGCLRIGEVPEDSSPFYPPGYWQPRRLSAGKALLRRLRDEAALLGTGITGKLLLKLHPYPYPSIRGWFRRSGSTRECRILDVGCGSGEFVGDLARIGFRNPLGVDPYLPRSVAASAGARLVSGTVGEIEGLFDLITFHHSLEHIADQHGTLRSATRLLADDGCCIIRIPLASSFAWEHYGEDWVQLDAPRHLFLHTKSSIRRLAEAAGLVLDSVEYDSTAFQFWGSELYRRGIPLAPYKDSPTAFFSRSELNRYAAKARALNKMGQGDQAAFFFRKAT